MPVRLLFVLAGIACAAENPVQKLWGELQAKREKLGGIHQEFAVSRSFRLSSDTQSATWDIILDASGPNWRENRVSGSGSILRIFSGGDFIQMEEDGDEFVRLKRPGKTVPQPEPYATNDFMWSKAVEKDRRPCGLGAVDHTCVILEIPTMPSMEYLPVNRTRRVLGGNHSLAIDLETGLILVVQATESVEEGREAYLYEITHQLKKGSWATVPNESLFGIPKSAQEVKKLSPWSDAKLRKTLVGKPAPALDVMDMNRKPFSLSSLRGRTVLLDFWASWCPPCRADIPTLEKLHRKYGADQLTIMAISVSEERSVVEKFLQKNPHGYGVALSTENELPRAYQVQAFPTYIVIDKDGVVSSVISDDQSLSELRSKLKKAGMDLD